MEELKRLRLSVKFRGRILPQGEQVVCVENLRDFFDLQIGKVYTVKKDVAITSRGTGALFLTEGRGLGHSPSRFVLYKDFIPSSAEADISTSYSKWN